MKIAFALFCAVWVCHSAQVAAQDEPVTLDCRYDVQWNRPAKNDMRNETGKTITYTLGGGRFWDFSGDSWADIYEITERSFILQETHDYLSGSIEGTIIAINRETGDIQRETTTCYAPDDCMTELWHNGVCEPVDYIDPDKPK